MLDEKSRSSGRDFSDSESAESSNRSYKFTNGQLVVPPDQISDDEFDMNGTSRKEYENEYYKRICSEVIDGFLYLGSDFVASDKETL